MSLFLRVPTLLGSVGAAPFNFTATRLASRLLFPDCQCHGSRHIQHLGGGGHHGSALPLPHLRLSILPRPRMAPCSPPADVAISAEATVSSGTVTNVSFFSGTTLLGSVEAPPFNFTATGLQAGSYFLTAVATAAAYPAPRQLWPVSVISSATSIRLTVPAVSNGFVSFSYSRRSGVQLYRCRFLRPL
jgi:hypothetical protein